MSKMRQIRRIHALGRVALGLALPLALMLALASAPCFALATELKLSGYASWYGKKQQGRKTASGEIFDMHDFTAAHPSLEFGTQVEVRNVRTGKTVTVRINDRGPFGRKKKKRIIDLSYAAAKKIGIVRRGKERVELRLLD